HSLTLSLALSHSSLFRSLPLFHLLPHSCGCFFFPLFLLPILFLTLFYSAPLVLSLSHSLSLWWLFLFYTLSIASSVSHSLLLFCAFALSLSLSLSISP